MVADTVRSSRSVGALSEDWPDNQRERRGWEGGRDRERMREMRDEVFYLINPWFISRGETLEKLMRHPKRMLQKQMKLQYIQKTYPFIFRSFLP